MPWVVSALVAVVSLMIGWCAMEWLQDWLWPLGR